MSRLICRLAFAAGLCWTPAQSVAAWAPSASADDAMACSAVLTASAVRREQSRRRPPGPTTAQRFDAAEAWHDEAWRRGGVGGPEHHEVGDMIDAKIRPLLWGEIIGLPRVEIPERLVKTCIVERPERS